MPVSLKKNLCSWFLLGKERGKELKIVITLENATALPTALEEASLPTQEAASLLPLSAPFYPWRHLRGIYILHFYITFSSPVTVAFFPYFLSESPYTVFLEHQTFLSPNCGWTMLTAQIILLCGKWSESFLKTQFKWHSLRNPSHRPHGPRANWIFF